MLEVEVGKDTIFTLDCGKKGAKKSDSISLTTPEIEMTYEVDKNKFVSKAENCVFNGWKVTGTIEHVIIDGQEKEIKHYDR